MLHVSWRHVFSWQQATISRKQITEASQDPTMTRLFWFPNHYPVQSECKHQKQWFLPFLCSRPYFVPLSVYLPSSDLIQPSFDSPHSTLNPSLSSACRSWQPTLHKAPSKHVGMYGKYSLVECHQQSLPNKGNQKAVESHHKAPDQPFTAFSITHR